MNELLSDVKDELLKQGKIGMISLGIGLAVLQIVGLIAKYNDL